jgi:hypothetical protein
MMWKGPLKRRIVRMRLRIIPEQPIFVPPDLVSVVVDAEREAVTDQTFLHNDAEALAKV